MKTKPSPDRTSLSRLVASEDLRAGDEVSILSQTYEFPSFFWCDLPIPLSPNEPIRIRLQSAASGTPLRVLDVCLPFVLVREPCGEHRTLDIRRCQLVHLEKQFAKRVRKAMRCSMKRPRKRKRK